MAYKVHSLIQRSSAGWMVAFSDHQRSAVASKRDELQREGKPARDLHIVSTPSDGPEALTAIVRAFNGVR